MIELGYIEKRVNTSVTATTEATANTIVTLPFILFDGSTDIIIEVGMNAWGQTSTSAVNRLVLFDDSGSGASAIGTLFQGVAFSTSTGKPGFTVRRKFTPAAGYHQYSLRGWVSVASTWTIAGDTFGAGIDAPAYMRVTMDEAMVRPTVVQESFFDFTTTDAWAHTAQGVVGSGNGLIRSAVVFVIQNASATDSISGVTYGGVAMTRVPTNGLAVDTAGEPGAVYVYFLDSDTIPQDTQTVAVTVSTGTTAKQGRCFTLQSDGPTRIVASGKQEGDAANPSVTLATPASFSGVILNALFSGQNSPGSATPGITPILSGRDFGTTIGVFEGGFGSGANIASGWTATTEDVAMSTLAIDTGALINAVAGSYAITGAAATLLAGAALSADPGSYAVTGADAIFVSGLVLTLDPGVYAVTGANAAVLADRVLAADPGAYVITGLDATLTALGAAELVADPGSYLITGLDATLEALGASVLSADPGSYAVNGAAATLSTGYLLAADSGVYAITGANATMLAALMLAADPGSYLITGANATLSSSAVPTGPGTAISGDRQAAYASSGDRRSDP